MRAIAVSMILVAGAGSTPAWGQPRCEVQAVGADSRDIRCPLSTSGTGQQFRVRANFSGGHDDTTASMTASLDGAALVCGEGSKTSLMGEDGDISLECRFSLTDKPGMTRVLRVLVTWRHAQYTGFEFHSD